MKVSPFGCSGSKYFAVGGSAVLEGEKYTSGRGK